MGDPPQKSTKCKFIVNMYFIYNPYQLQKSFMYNVLSQIMLFYYLHRLTRAHSPLSCAMDK